MDAHDRDLDQHESDRPELSAFRGILLEPIEDSGRRVDESAVLLAPVGRSWGP
jgi:hypothetical protein